MATKKVRLLVDHGNHKANDVVELDAADAKALEDAGHADGSAAAVKYASGLPQNQKQEDSGAA